VSELEGPWYKQFWLWFIVTPLLVVFALGFSMLYLAIKTNDGVVVDNYYKDGKGIFVRKDEDALARAQNLRADLLWADDKLMVSLTGDLTPLPEALRLLFIFPTAQAGDVSVLLQHQGLGQYQGRLAEPVIGNRQLQIQPVGESVNWRLHGSGMIPPASASMILLPKQQ
jgi:hypothetical protein|tara:strand:- start:1684 stop:2190 length:507 start_codon:yes stop_codon:yes gene_type:complete